MKSMAISIASASIMASISLIPWGCGPTGTTSADLSIDSPFHSYDAPEVVVGISGYRTLTSTNPAFSVEVPSNWEEDRMELTEGIYSGGWMVTLRGPADTSTDLGFTAMTITVIPVSGSTATLSQLSQSLIADRAVASGATSTDSETTLAGQAAREATLSDEDLRLQDFEVLDSLKTQSIWISTPKDNFYVDIRYYATQVDYDTYLEAYSRAKESFQSL